jgi:hypothetical protein
VAWIDKDIYAVVDQKNQKIKLLATKYISENGIKSMAFPDCLVVSPFKNGLAYHTSGGRLIILNSAMMKENEFAGVSTLLTCLPKSAQVSWISGFGKICVFNGKELKDMIIHDQNAPVIFDNPMFGHVLSNGMFVVSDWVRDCIFIIQKSGYIERRKYCSVGALSSDINNNIYVCDFRESLIVVFRVSGETLQTYKTSPFLRNPKSIAVNANDCILISNETSVVLAELL